MAHHFLLTPQSFAKYEKIIFFYIFLRHLKKIKITTFIMVGTNMITVLNDFFNIIIAMPDVRTYTMLTINTYSYMYMYMFMMSICL